MKKLFILFAALIATCSFAQPSKEVLNKNSCPKVFKLNDTVNTFSCTPLYDKPDIVNAKNVSNSSTYFFISKVNDKYFKVTDGKNTGYLFIGWIRDYDSCQLKIDQDYYTEKFYKENPLSKEDSSRDIITGPRGGKYYINNNGNKTYVK